MEEYAFIQSCRKLNYHDDIILRTPTLSTGERMFSMCFKNSKDNSRILEFDDPKCEKDILEIMKDLRWNAEKNIWAIQKVRSLNGLLVCDIMLLMLIYNKMKFCNYGKEEQ